MSKSLDLSKFNVANIDPALLDFDYIKLLKYDRVTGTITLILSDDTEQQLGSYLPDSPKDVTKVELVNNQVIVTLSDGQSINAGELSFKETVSYPTVSGTGLLTASGVYKPLVSDTTEVVITETPEKISVDYVSPEVDDGQSSTAVGTKIELSVFAEQRLTSNANGVVNLGDTQATSWHVRSLNHLTNNQLNVSLDNGGLVLGKGHYYIEATAKAFQTGKSELQLVNNASEIYLRSPEVNATKAISTVDLHLSGYFYLEADTRVTLRQYAELASVGGLGKAQYGGVWGDTSSFCKVSIWKVGDAIPVNDPVVPHEYTQAAKDWQSLYNTRKDVKYSTSLLPFAVTGGVQTTVNIVHGNTTYFIHTTTARPYVTKYNSVTKVSYPIEVSPDVAAALHGGDYSWWCPPILVDGLYYLIPYTAKFVVVFDPVSEKFCYTNFGRDFNGGRKWPQAVYVPAINKIVGCPIDAAGFLVVDLNVPNYKVNYSTIPNLQNGMVGGFKVTSGGLHDGRYIPQKAFNNTLATTEQDSWISQNGPAPTDAAPHWIQVEYPVGTEVTSWTMQNSSTAGVVQATKGALKGSFDGITWVTLDTWEVTKASLVPMALRPTRPCSNVAAYKFYRKEFYKNSGEQNFVYIPRLYLMTTDESKGVVAMEQFIDTTTPSTDKTGIYYLTTPDMQGSVTPGFSLTASGTHSAPYQPHIAFRSAPSSAADGVWLSQNGPEPSLANPHWIAVEYPEPIVIQAWTIQDAAADQQVWPTKGFVQASNDGITWVTLDTWVYPVSSMVPQGVRPVRKLNNQTAYKRYRVAVTEKSGSRAYIGITRVYFLSSDPSVSYHPSPRPFLFGATATIENFGLPGMGAADKFGGIALANNGNLYATPYHASSIVKINPVAMTASVIGNSAGNYKWLGAYYSPEQNKVVGIPYHSTNFLVIDASDDTFTTPTLGLTLPGGTKYLYNFYDPVKHQVCANPLIATDLMFLDLATLTAKLVKNIWQFPTTTWYAWSGVTANRKIQTMLMGDTTKIYEIDADNYAQSVQWSGMMDMGKGGAGSRYTGLAVGSSGLAAGLPGSAFNAIVTDGRSMYPIEHNLLMDSTQKFLGAVGYDGDVYGVPGTSTKLLKIAMPKSTPGFSLETASVIDSVQYYHLNPKMASNSQSGIKVTSSGELAGYEAWKAVDREYGTDSESWVSEPRSFNASNPHFWMIEFPEARELKAIRIRNTYNFSLVTGEVQGSNDGTSWTTMYTIPQESANQWIAWGWRKLWVLDNPALFKFYRVAAFTSGHASYFGIADILLLSDKPSNPASILGTERELATVVNGVKYYHTTPSMHANLSGRHVAFADSQYDGNYPACKVFQLDLSSTTGEAWFGRNGPTPTVANPCWVGIAHPYPVVVNAYVIQDPYNASFGVLDGKLQGSQDGINWVDLHTLTRTPSDVAAYKVSTIYNLSNSVGYQYHRLLCTKSNGGAYVGVARLFLLSTNKYDLPNAIGAVLPVKANKLANHLVVPEMTGPNQNTNVVTITSSGDYPDGKYPAWKAFNRIHPGGAFDEWITEARAFNESNPHWIQLTFATPVKVVEYQLKQGYYPITKGRFLGSNDGNNWVTLHDFEVVSPGRFSVPGLSAISNPGVYKMYRFAIFAGERADFNSLGELEVFGEGGPLETATNLTIKEVFDYNLSVPSGNNKWYSGGYSPLTKKIYFIPNSNTDVGVLDPVIGKFTTTTFGYPFNGTHLLADISPQGKMLLVGKSTNALVSVDLVSGTAKSVLSTEKGLFATTPFAGGKWSIDDRALLCPFSESKVGIYDHELESMMAHGGFTEKSTSNQLAGVCLLANGKSLFPVFGGSGQAPYTYDAMQMVLEKLPGTYSVGASGYDSATTLPNGLTISLCNTSATRVMVYTPSTPSPVPLSMLLDPRINRS